MGEQLIGETDYYLCCSVRAVEEGKHHEAKLNDLSVGRRSHSPLVAWVQVRGRGYISTCAATSCKQRAGQ
jgi:hypothetical protein